MNHVRRKNDIIKKAPDEDIVGTIEKYEKETELRKLLDYSDHGVEYADKQGRENMKIIYLKDFRIAGDPFYTETVRLYCNKTGIESISTIDEINSLEEKVTELMITDINCPISSYVNKMDLIKRYFLTLQRELSEKAFIN